jgi:hypothetical protein
MKITVKVQDIEICVDDSNINPIIKFYSEVQKTIELICNEALKLLKEQKL